MRYLLIIICLLLSVPCFAEVSVVDGNIIKSTEVTSEVNGEKEVRIAQEVYTPDMIDEAIARCSYLAVKVAEGKEDNWEHNVQCLEAEKAVYEGYKKLIPKEEEIIKEVNNA